MMLTKHFGAKGCGNPRPRRRSTVRAVVSALRNLPRCTKEQAGALGSGICEVRQGWRFTASACGGVRRDLASAPYQ